MQFEPVCAGCKIAMLAQPSVTMDGMRPTMINRFNSTETLLATDSGVSLVSAFTVRNIGMTSLDALGSSRLPAAMKCVAGWRSARIAASLGSPTGAGSHCPGIGSIPGPGSLRGPDALVQADSPGDKCHPCRGQ